MFKFCNRSVHIKNVLISRGYFLNEVASRGCSVRTFSHTKPILQQSQLSEDVKRAEGAVTVGAKVKQAGKDASYIGILLVGFGVTGALIWYVANELLFGFSSNAVYTKALKLCKDHSMVNFEVGDGIKGYGEETSRGRRRHVTYQEYIVDGTNHMRVQFYVQGSKGKGTVQCEAVETSRRNFEFRYIFVQMHNQSGSRPIIVLDNR